MKQLVILAIFSVAFSQPDQEITGYLRQVEASFCMDECSEYYIETFVFHYIVKTISSI